MWLVSRIGFLAETGTHDTITVLSIYDFSPFSLPCCFLRCLSPFFLSPPRRPYAGIFLSFVLLRACSSYLSFLSTYAFLMAAFLISVRFFIS